MQKPYYSLNDFFQNKYGEKCYKIAIDTGLSCPNRDGKIGFGGCTFCSAGGSGDFAVSRTVGSISDQIEAGLSLFKDKKVGNRFVAYYQAYTNTYGEISLLENLYREGLSHPQIIGISIATRPDCLSDEVLDLLTRLQKEYPDKFIWIELGLQTCHEHTAVLIRRGYPLSVFEKAMANLSKRSIPVIVHVILGLPGESATDMYETVSYLNRFHPFGIKLQLLHVLKGTELAKQYGFTDSEGEVSTCAFSPCTASSFSEEDNLTSPSEKVVLPALSPKKDALSPLSEKDALPTPTEKNTISPLSGKNALPPLHILELEEYIDIVIRCLELLDPKIVIHRLTGDGPKELLLAPKWSLNKRNVLNTLHKALRQRQTYQGREYHASRSIDTL